MAEWVWPVPGYATITSGVGPRWGSSHNGIDIGAPYGADIVASKAGTVIQICTSCSHNYGKDYGCGCGGNYGNYVYIDHGDGFKVWYAHMTQVKVSEGDKVIQGQKIGTVGSTGWSTGAHLHFEMRQNGNVKDPENYVDPTNTKIVNVGVTVNKLTQFLNIAQKQLGKKGDWTWSTSGLTRGEPWCAAFVVACAKSVGGLLGVVIPNSFGCSSMISIGVANKLGTWIRGKHLTGKSVTPCPGDLIFYPIAGTRSDYSARHVGIVKEVKNNTIYSIAGNSVTWDNYTSEVGIETRSLNSSDVLGYFRPNWSKVGGGYVASGGQLYPKLNTREDAILREVGYIDNKHQPSIQSSDIKLSIINYTTTLAELFSSGIYNFAGIANAHVSANVSDSSLSDEQINVANQVFSLLQTKGLNAAACIGVLGNMYHESKFRPDASYITSTEQSYGLCQWNEAAGRYVRRAVGSDWATNVSGQIDFLWTELENNMPGLKTYLENVPNTEAGAMDAAERFVRIFEVPDKLEYNVTIRRAKAKEYWNCTSSILT